MDATQTTELEVYVDTSGFVDTSGSMSSSNRSIVSRDESEIEEGEYAADIFTYLKRRERIFCPRDYLKSVRSLAAKGRMNAIDWLVGTIEAFEYPPEVTSLAVRLMDLYWSKQPTVNNDLMVPMACASMLIAAKLQSVGRDVPDLEIFCRYVNETHQVDQLMRDEHALLRTLHGELNAPSALQALRYYARVLNLDSEPYARALYYLEVSLYFLQFCRLSESQLGAAALLLALRTSKVGDWSLLLERTTGFTCENIEPLMWQLNHMLLCYQSKYPSIKQVQAVYSGTLYGVANAALLPDQHPLNAPIKPPPLAPRSTAKRKALAPLDNLNVKQSKV